MEEFCYVVVIDVFLLEDENYESNLCVVNDSIVMCIKQRRTVYICLSLNAQEEVGRKPNSIIPCLWRDTVNSKRSMRKSNIAHFNSYEGFYITF